MKTKQDKPNMISYHRNQKQTTWIKHLAIKEQWPGVIYQVKKEIQKVLIFLKQNSR